MSSSAKAICSAASSRSGKWRPNIFVRLICVLDIFHSQVSNLQQDLGLQKSFASQLDQESRCSITFIVLQSTKALPDYFCCEDQACLVTCLARPIAQSYVSGPEDGLDLPCLTETELALPDRRRRRAWLFRVDTRCRRSAAGPRQSHLRSHSMSSGRRRVLGGRLWPGVRSSYFHRQISSKAAILHYLSKMTSLKLNYCGFSAQLLHFICKKRPYLLLYLLAAGPGLQRCCWQPSAVCGQTERFCASRQDGHQGAGRL